MSEERSRPAAESEASSDDATRDTVPVVEEQLAVGRRVVETARGVRVHREVETRTAHVDEPVVHDDVDVQRVACDRTLEAPLDPWYDGDTLVVPVIEEVLVVEKRLVLKEEIRITRRRTETRHMEDVSLRRDAVHVERLDDAASTASPARDAAADDSLIERRRRETVRRRSDLEGSSGED